MADFEYATTSALASDATERTRNPAPAQPSGSGWEMSGSTAVVDEHAIGTRLFWFWRRSLERPGACPNCGALARKDGRCLGCEREVGR